MALVGASTATSARAFQVQALLARYTLDERDGPTAHDASSNSQHGRFTTGVDLGFPGPVGTTAARFRPGQSGRVQVPEHLGLELVDENVSIAAWVRPAADDETMGIFGADEAGWFCARTREGLVFHVRYVQEFIQPCDVPVGDWTHVAFVFDTGYDVTVYVDGELVGFHSGIWPAYPAGPEWSVGSTDGTSEFWDGLLADVQVYVGALTPDEARWLRDNPGLAFDPVVGTPYCFGDGHGTLCPCFNYGPSDAGCANSTGTGGRLRSRGSSSVWFDDLLLSADQLAPNQPALLFASDGVADEGSGVQFGDGLRCTQGATVRLGVRPADGEGHVQWPTGLAAAGGWAAGDTRSFQAWYRDPSGPCGSGFNLTQGLRVAFAP